jgi:hypothetical protein
MVANDGRSVTALEYSYDQPRDRSKKHPTVRAQSNEKKEEPTRVIETPDDETDPHNYTALAKKAFSLLPYSTMGWLVTTLYGAWVQTNMIQKQASIHGWEFDMYSRQGLLLLDLICTGMYTTLHDPPTGRS